MILLTAVNTLLFPVLLPYVFMASVSGDGFARGLSGIFYALFLTPIICVIGVILTISVVKVEVRISNVKRSFIVGYCLLLPAIIIVGMYFSLHDPRTQLMQAAAEGDSARVEEILQNKRENINKMIVFHGRGTNALREAIKNNKIDVVRTLIKYGVAIEDESYPPIIFASDHNRTEIVNLLINSGADINSEAFFKENALERASDKGYISIVKLLIEHNAIEDSKDKAARALERSCLSGFPQVTELLVEHGADQRLINENGCHRWSIRDACKECADSCEEGVGNSN